MNIKRIFAAAAFTGILAFMLPTLSGCSRINENPAESVTVTSAGSLSAVTEFDDSRYIYSQLSEEERGWYEIIRSAAENFEPAAVFPEKIDPETLKKLFVAVYYQEEDIFWLTSMFYRPSSDTDTLKLTYRFSKDETEQMKSAIKAVTDSIFAGFDENTSDYEKLKAFHDHLVLNCTFSKDTDYVNTVYGCLCDGYAQCEGYAFSFDYLCRLADIDCFTVTGTNPQGDVHAWNIVKLEDMWYQVDCTWDDPILDPVDEEFVRYFYFLVTDADIVGVTHIPDNSYFSYPLCTASSNYYKREGYLAASGEEGRELLLKAVTDALSYGRKDAAVRFANRRAYDAAMSRLFDSKEIKQVLADANAVSQRKVLEGRFVRYCNEDELIIHISMIYES